MAANVWTNPGRWRTFADAVALALGVNVWVSLVLVPGFFVGAWSDKLAIVMALTPAVPLVFGVLRKSELVLLLGFPACLLLPIAVAPEVVEVHVYGPVRFTVVAIGLVGYLLGASVFTSFREAPPPVGSRPLSSSQRPVPERWLRRLRVYRGLFALSILFPAVLIYTINFDSSNLDQLRQRFPGRVAGMTLVLNISALAFWLLVYYQYFLGTLRPHRTGDRDLLADLARERREARRGRPRTAFYVGVACALGFMLVLLFSRFM